MVFALFEKQWHCVKISRRVRRAGDVPGGVMQSFSRAAPPLLLAGCICLVLVLPGCAGSRYASVKPSPGSSPAAAYSGFVRADVEAAYGACLARCNEQGALAAVTREGCFKGCAEARRRAELRDRDFASRQECADAMREVELNRDLYIDDHKLWCDGQWEHLHKRKGCYDAVTTFYTNLTEASVCGGQSSQTRGYGQAAGASATPLAPAGTGPAPAASVPAPVPVYGGAQPAPAPAYAGPAATPYLQDTPKYQTGRRSAKSSRITSAPKAAPAKPAVAKPAPAKTGKAGKSAAAKSAAPAGPVEKDRPAPAAPDLVRSEPAAPAAPQAAPAAPSSAVSPPPAAQAAPSAPVAPATPVAPVTSSKPASPAASSTPPQMTDGPTLRVPKEDRILDAPDTPPKPATETDPAEPPAGVIPPVPSMLQQPYIPPAIITPQVEPEPGK